MTEDATRAFEHHEAFERTGNGFAATTTPFEATVRAEGDDYLVAVRLPTLDAVVVGETVAPVVEDGWFETLERRLADADGVTQAADLDAPALERRGDVVLVEVGFSARASIAAAEAKAVVDYVEGTYMQGVIPGYEYDDPVAAVRERARGRADGDGPPR